MGVHVTVFAGGSTDQRRERGRGWVAVSRERRGRALRRKHFAALSVAAILVVALSACRPPVPSSQLKSFQVLLGASGDFLSSSSQMYILTMQTDGNLVERLSQAANSRQLWSTNTAGHPGAQLDMRADGNLVLNAPGWVPLWSTNTAGHPGAKLEVLDTGSLVVVAPDGTILWSSNSTNDRLTAGDRLWLSNVGTCICVTSADDHYFIKMNSDGNLSLNATGGAQIWSTAPGGAPGDVGYMLANGYFMLMRNTLVDWSTPVSAGAGGYLQVQDDGHLALKTAAGTAVWTVP
jgi:hypothetical protein